LETKTHLNQILSFCNATYSLIFHFEPTEKENISSRAAFFRFLKINAGFSGAPALLFDLFSQNNVGKIVSVDRGSQPGVLVPPRGTRLNIKGYEDPWVTEQLMYLL